MTVGNISAISRPTPSDDVGQLGVGGAEPLAARASSRTNARTTRMPVICSRSTRLTRVDARPASAGTAAPSGAMISADDDDQHRHDDQRAAPDSGTSWRSAMMMPPTHMIGADDHQREGHQHQHLHLLDVVGGAGDQRRRAELADLAGREAPAPGGRSRRAGRGRAPSRSGRRSRPRRSRRRSARSVTREHHAADAQDVAGVALDDAVVDDVGVQASAGRAWPSSATSWSTTISVMDEV